MPMMRKILSVGALTIPKASMHASGNPICEKDTIKTFRPHVVYWQGKTILVYSAEPEHKDTHNNHYLFEVENEQMYRSSRPFHTVFEYQNRLMAYPEGDNAFFEVNLD